LDAREYKCTFEIYGAVYRCNAKVVAEIHGTACQYNKNVVAEMYLHNKEGQRHAILSKITDLTAVDIESGRIITKHGVRIL
jgi:hypothetical protein